MTILKMKNKRQKKCKKNQDLVAFHFVQNKALNNGKQPKHDQNDNFQTCQKSRNLVAFLRCNIECQKIRNLVAFLRCNIGCQKNQDLNAFLRCNIEAILLYIVKRQTYICLIHYN